MCVVSLVVTTVVKTIVKAVMQIHKTRDVESGCQRIRVPPLAHTQPPPFPPFACARMITNRAFACTASPFPPRPLLSICTCGGHVCICVYTGRYACVSACILISMHARAYTHTHTTHTGNGYQVRTPQEIRSLQRAHEDSVLTRKLTEDTVCVCVYV